MSALLRMPPRQLEAGRRTLVLAWIIGSIPWIAPIEPLAAQLWEPADLLTIIGRLDGSGPDVFGRVRTTEVDGAGNVYVLDEQTSGIHVFDSDGDHITSYRRSGQGPRELRGIRGSDLDSQGILHVADAGNGRISTFQLEGDSLAFRGVTTLRFAPEDVCVMGGRRYVLHQPGPPGEPTISEIDGDGRPVRRFASPLGVQIDGPRWAYQRHELIVLDALSGRLAERHPAVGIVGSVGDGRLFTFGEDPFPQVRVFGTR